MAHPSTTPSTARASFWTSVCVAGWLWLVMLLVGGQSLDAALLRFSYAGADERLARAAALVTALGGWAVLTTLTIAAAAYLVVVERVRRAILLLLIVLGGRAAVALMKRIVARDRPDVDARLVLTHSMSFPSGHAANTLITCLAIALLVPVFRPSRSFAVAIGVALALVVGWSRVALGVHWPSDVISGWAFGFLWTIVCLRVASGVSASHGVTASHGVSGSLAETKTTTSSDSGATP